MSPLKLNGSTSGFVALDAPAAAGSNTLVLPTGNGSNGQVLTTNGSGTLSWSTVTSSQWTTSGSNIYYTTGSVGVNNTSPGAKFHVIGGTTAGSVDTAAIFTGGSGTVGSGARIYLSGTPGFETTRGAYIEGVHEASTNAHGLRFATNATTADPVERIRIASNGNLYVAKTAEDRTVLGMQYNASGGVLSITANDTRPLDINRQTNDGDLILFFQANTQEGSISVSGTTVSYNGAHLSRYSQLPSGAEREEILRGTVLSNLDEMCEWGEEDNEQLNRMKVSDVEGDKNVSGVFQAWDDDDDTYVNDFYCAMTGDFIIRIAADVTVERGDLLMSAGDGTAKPQDDDIIRSKTIAKVTSTHVTCTYDDGSYCVPCVLMAC